MGGGEARAEYLSVEWFTKCFTDSSKNLIGQESNIWNSWSDEWIHNFCEIIHQKEWTFWWINTYYYKKVTKIGGISFIENVIKIGENSFTKKVNIVVHQ